MPVLHFRITQQDQPIDLSRTLHSQNCTLRRITIVRNISIPSNIPVTVDPLIPLVVGLAPTPYFVPTYTDPLHDMKGGIIIDVSFFKGFEVLSNFSSNDIMCPFNNMESVVDNRFEQNFANEDISLSFNVKVYNYKRENTLKFVDDTGVEEADPAAIKYIDMFFEFDELFEYNTY